MTVMSGDSRPRIARRTARSEGVRPQSTENGALPMSIFRNLPIARKFVFAFGIVCLLCALQGALAIYGFVSIKSTVSEIVENGMPARRALGEIRLAIAQTRRSDLALL